jgi:magnesium transporter
MMRSLYRAQDGSLRTNLSSDETTTALEDKQGLLWVDLMDEAPEACEPILRETFGFHPLAVEDALQEVHVPKLDDWGQYLYLVLHAIDFDKQNGGEVNTLELDVFLGQNYIVTYHKQSIVAVGRLWEACQRDERHLKRGADHLLYRLADALVASYMPVIEGMDETLDLIEDQIFGEPTPATLEQLFSLKRALLHLRRIIAPQREVLNKLARDDYAVIDAEDRIWFRDVYDHLVRMYDINESMRELMSGALDTYLSVVNNRMTEVMKTLTIITTLFMPMSFVVGFFGMNFFQAVTPLEVWTGKPAFVMTIAIMILIPLAMYLWVRQRAWM